MIAKAMDTKEVGDRPFLEDIPSLGEDRLPRRIENAGQGSYRIVFEGVEADETRMYVKKLEAAGFVKHAENKIDDVLFYTYYNDDCVLTVIWTDQRRCTLMTVTVDPRGMTNLVPPANENTWTKVIESSFTQVGLYYDPDREANAAYRIMMYVSGMCYVMRLEDGSFIVIDGGYNYELHADHIYETMKKQAPDPNHIVVAAWILSHSHGDHIPFFLHFCPKYGDKVTVEKVIHSFPFAEGDGIMKRVRNTFPDAKFYKSHAGQKYHLRNAEVEILYSFDLWINDVETMKDTNVASQVVTIRAGGTKFMILGDYGEDGATMMDLYSPQTLKSDVMQLAHHGVSDGSNKMNRIIGAKYIFWPVAMNMEPLGEMKTGYVYWGKPEGIKHGVPLLTRARNKHVVDQILDGTVFVANDDVCVATFRDGVLDVDRYEIFDDYMADRKAVCFDRSQWEALLSKK